MKKKKMISKWLIVFRENGVNNEIIAHGMKKMEFELFHLIKKVKEKDIAVFFYYRKDYFPVIFSCFEPDCTSAVICGVPHDLEFE